METQFVPSELAVKLKELGFNELCIVGVKNNETLTGTGFTFTNFNNNVHDFVLPLWQQAFNWFMVNKNEMSVIHRYDDSKGFEKFLFKIHRPIKSTLTVNGFDTYEQARQACLEKLIELCK